jgi:hypothetical protein
VAAKAISGDVSSPVRHGPLSGAVAKKSR